MAILAWIILGWVFACCAVTFAWCVLVEACRWQQRRNLSGSVSPPGVARTPTRPEPGTIALTVVDATGHPQPPTERRASHLTVAGSTRGDAHASARVNQERATVRHLHVP